MMPEQRTIDDGLAEPTLDVRAYVRMVLHRRRLVLVVAGIIVALAAVYTATRTPAYTATSEVQVNPVLTNPLQASRPTDVNMDTETHIAGSLAVAELAAQNLTGSAPAPTILKHASVEAESTSTVLKFSYTDRSPAEARAGAEAFAQAYLGYRQQQAQDTVQQQVATLDQELQAVHNQINEINGKISRLPLGSDKLARLQSQLDLAMSRNTVLQNQLITYSAVTIDPGQIIDHAALPTSPSSPKPVRNLAAALVLGLVLGGALAIGLERSHDVIRDADELEAHLRAPVLGLVPAVSRHRAKRGGALVLGDHRDQGITEAYRGIRTAVLAAASRDGLKTLLVTSAMPREGKSTVAVNLGVTLAEVGKAVVVVAADVRRPGVAALLGFDHGPGLTDVLSGGVRAVDALRPTAIRTLGILPPGSSAGHVPDPLALLGSEEMKRTITEFARIADFVVIEAPPILPVADAFVLAGLVDAVVFVADAETTPTPAVARARQRIERAGARLLGGVLNRAQGPRGADDYYGSEERTRWIPSLGRWRGGPETVTEDVGPPAEEAPAADAPPPSTVEVDHEPAPEMPVPESEVAAPETPGSEAPTPAASPDGSESGAVAERSTNGKPKVEGRAARSRRNGNAPPVRLEDASGDEEAEARPRA